MSKSFAETQISSIRSEIAEKTQIIASLKQESMMLKQQHAEITMNFNALLEEKESVLGRMREQTRGDIGQDAQTAAYARGVTSDRYNERLESMDDDRDKIKDKINELKTKIEDEEEELHRANENLSVFSGGRIYRKSRRINKRKSRRSRINKRRSRRSRR